MKKLEEQKEKDAKFERADEEVYPDEVLSVCLICLDRLPAVVAHPGPCAAHRFCFGCLYTWSKRKRTCPVDRKLFQLILLRNAANGNLIGTIPTPSSVLDEDEVTRCDSLANRENVKDCECGNSQHRLCEKSLEAAAVQHQALADAHRPIITSRPKDCEGSLSEGAAAEARSCIAEDAGVCVPQGRCFPQLAQEAAQMPRSNVCAVRALLSREAARDMLDVVQEVMSHAAGHVVGVDDVSGCALLTRASLHIPRIVKGMSRPLHSRPASRCDWLLDSPLCWLDSVPLLEQHLAPVGKARSPQDWVTSLSKGADDSSPQPSASQDANTSDTKVEAANDSKLEAASDSKLEVANNVTNNSTNQANSQGSGGRDSEGSRSHKKKKRSRSRRRSRSGNRRRSRSGSRRRSRRRRSSSRHRRSRSGDRRRKSRERRSRSRDRRSRRSRSPRRSRSRERRRSREARRRWSPRRKSRSPRGIPAPTPLPARPAMHQSMVQSSCEYDPLQPTDSPADSPSQRPLYSSLVQVPITDDVSSAKKPAAQSPLAMDIDIDQEIFAPLAEEPKPERKPSPPKVPFFIEPFQPKLPSPPPQPTEPPPPPPPMPEDVRSIPTVGGSRLPFQPPPPGLPGQAIPPPPLGRRPSLDDRIAQTLGEEHSKDVSEELAQQQHALAKSVSDTLTQQAMEEMLAEQGLPRSMAADMLAQQQASVAARTRGKSVPLPGLIAGQVAPPVRPETNEALRPGLPIEPLLRPPVMPVALRPPLHRPPLQEVRPPPALPALNPLSPPRIPSSNDIPPPPPPREMPSQKSSNNHNEDLGLDSSTLNEIKMIGSLLSVQQTLKKLKSAQPEVDPRKRQKNDAKTLDFKVPAAPRAKGRSSGEESRSGGLLSSIPELEPSSSPSDEPADYSPSFTPPFTAESSAKPTEHLSDDGLKRVIGSLQSQVSPPASATALDNQEKYLRKLNRMERVVEEVKVAMKPHYSSRAISKDEYKAILRKAVPKITHSKSGSINPAKVKKLIEGYIKKIVHDRKKQAA